MNTTAIIDGEQVKINPNTRFSSGYTPKSMGKSSSIFTNLIKTKKRKNTFFNESAYRKNKKEGVQKVAITKLVNRKFVYNGLQFDTLKLLLEQAKADGCTLYRQGVNGKRSFPIK